MEYDEWIAAGNGVRKGESLEDAIGRTVNSMYDFPLNCPSCGSQDLECPFNNNHWRCESCGHSWYHR
ncbi:MAG: hypothetical protein LBH16_07255 [Treponema sp.]|jgi:transposase-like protein|nr:hypothetical protein [Treponema sp.]